LRFALRVGPHPHLPASVSGVFCSGLEQTLPHFVGPPPDSASRCAWGPIPTCLLRSAAFAARGWSRPSPTSWGPLPTPLRAARGAPSPLACFGQRRLLLGSGADPPPLRGAPSRLRFALRVGPHPHLPASVSGVCCSGLEQTLPHFVGPPPDSASRCAWGPIPTCLLRSAAFAARVWSRPSPTSW